MIIIIYTRVINKVEKYMINVILTPLHYIYLIFIENLFTIFDQKKIEGAVALRCGSSSKKSIRHETPGYE